MGKAARERNRQKYLDRVNAEERVKRGVPVFYLEQDTATERPGQGLRTRSEVQEMKAKGQGKFVDRGRAFRLFASAPEVRVILPPVPPSDSGDSDAAISVDEMRANVGEPPPGNSAMLARGTVKRAQQKIRAIGSHGVGTADTKAPLAARRAEQAISGRD